MTHQKMRKAVERALGRPIREKVWQVLEEEEYVRQAIDDEEEEGRGVGVKFLLEKVRKFESLSRFDEPAPPVEEEKETPPDRRFWALSRIVACLANQNQEVQKFREEVLGGRLLSLEEVPQWIEKQASKEQHTLTISLNVTAGEGWEERFLEEAKRFVEAEKAGGVWPHKEDITLLDYISPPSQWIHRVAINKNGVLGRLKHIAAKFKGIWNEAKAVHFILTGQALPVSPARIRTTYGAVPRITLEVSPHLKPEEVAKVYGKAKREYEQYFGQRRKLSEKHLMLAIFGAEEEGSWGQLVIKWNTRYSHKYPKPYNDRSSFAKDVRAAFENVTGWKWKTAPFNEKMDRASFEDLLREFNAE